MGSIALCAWSATALGLTSDQAATRAYLRAELVLARKEPAGYAADVKGLDELTAQIGKECPDVAAHAPHGRKLEEMEVETATAMLMAEFAPFRPQLAQFVQVAKHLRWSNHKLTGLVHTLASRFATLLITPPDLCADWNGWVASRYSALTASATRFVRAVRVFWAGQQEGEGEGIEGKISRLLRAYENGQDKRLVRTISRLHHHGESKQEMEAVGSAQEDMEVTLGLKQRKP